MKRINKKENKVLFKNETKCTEKEYNIFVKTHEKEYVFSENIYTIGYTIFLLFCGVLLLANKDILPGIILILLGILFLIYRLWHPQHIKAKQEKKIKQPFKNTYEFYNNYFCVSNVQGSSRTFYFKIYKVIETKTNFYIYISRDYAFLVSKIGFVNGDKEEFIKFLKKKVNIKYKLR